ncbi:MAG: VOC family protein [Dokdonella sp.]
MRLNQVTLPAIDILASVAFYRLMGFEQIVDSPHYARFVATDGDATFSIHKVDAVAGSSGVVVYFECAELDAKVATLSKRGITFIQQPQDERWLWSEARLLDPSGNVICLYHAGVNRLNPPWRIKS